MMVIVVLLMLQLQNVKRMLVVLATGPLALIGVALIMAVFRIPFGFVAMLGSLALFGMVLRNSVILIDQIESDRAHGVPPWDAIVGAARQMHTVIISECTGCDLCVEPCPVDCIDMIEVGSNLQSWKWNRPLAPGQLIATDREQAA